MSLVSRPWALLPLLLAAAAAYINPTPEPPGAVLYDRSWPYPAVSGGGGGSGWAAWSDGRQLWRREARLGRRALSAPVERYPQYNVPEEESLQDPLTQESYWAPPEFLRETAASGQLLRILSRKRRKHGRPQRWTMERVCEERGDCTCYSLKTRAKFCCDCEWGSCFPGRAGVTMATGERKTMDRLAAGDRVMTVTSDGQLTPTTVLGFLDRRPRAAGEYLHLHLASGHRLRLSTNHVTFTRRGGGAYAGQVVPGDELLVARENGTSYSPVVDVQYSIMEGAFVPLTEHGTLLVDGVWASNYASFPHGLCHALAAPFRLWPALLSDRFTVNDKNVLVGWLKRLGRLTVGAHPGGVLRLSAI